MRRMSEMNAKKRKNNSDARFVIYLFLLVAWGFVGTVYLPSILTNTSSYIDDPHYRAEQTVLWLLDVIYDLFGIFLVSKIIVLSNEIQLWREE